MILRVAGLAAVWVALWGRISPANVIWGVLVAVFLLWFVPDRTEALARLRPMAVLRLTVHMVANLVTSSLAVVVTVLRPTPERRAARVLEVQLHTRSPLVTTVVANSITMTPGTMTLAADPATHVIRVHVIGPVDPDRFATDIVRLEQLVAAALGAGGVE
jgi:multicomponent Na+:H+ antiporter subunit E